MAFAITISVLTAIFLFTWFVWAVISYSASRQIEKIEQEKKVQDAKDAIENAKAKKIQDARHALFEELYELQDEMYEYDEINGQRSWLSPGGPGAPGTKKRARYEELQSIP